MQLKTHCARGHSLGKAGEVVCDAGACAYPLSCMICDFVATQKTPAILVEQIQAEVDRWWQALHIAPTKKQVDHRFGDKWYRGTVSPSGAVRAVFFSPGVPDDAHIRPHLTRWALGELGMDPAQFAGGGWTVDGRVFGLD